MPRPCGRYSRPGFSQTISPSLNIATVRSAGRENRTLVRARCQERDGIRLHAGAGTVSATQYLIGDDSEITTAGSLSLIERCQFIKLGLRKHLYDGRQGIRAGTKFRSRCTPGLQETLDLSKFRQESPVLVRKHKLPDKVFGIGILQIGFLDHLVDAFPGSRPRPAPPGSTLVSLDVGIECSKADIFHGGENFVYPCFSVSCDQQAELKPEKILVLIHGAPLTIPSLRKISFWTSSNSSITKSRASPVIVSVADPRRQREPTVTRRSFCQPRPSC